MEVYNLRFLVNYKEIIDPKEGVFEVKQKWVDKRAIQIKKDPRKHHTVFVTFKGYLYSSRTVYKIFVSCIDEVFLQDGSAWYKILDSFYDVIPNLKPKKLVDGGEAVIYLDNIFEKDPLEKNLENLEDFFDNNDYDEIMIDNNLEEEWVI